MKAIVLKIAFVLMGMFILAACDDKAGKHIVESAAEDCKVFDKDIGDYYKGGCKDGLADGKGFARGRDTYHGDFVAGDPHGVGVYIWGSGTDWEGDKFEGQFSNSERTGAGKYTSRNGVIQDGEFINGQFKRGKKIFPEGIVLEGSFINHKADGIAKEQIPEAYMIGRESLSEDYVLTNGYYERQGLYRDNEFVVACITLEECAQKLSAKKAEEKKSLTRGQFRNMMLEGFAKDKSEWLAELPPEGRIAVVNCITDVLERMFFAEGQEAISTKSVNKEEFAIAASSCITQKANEFRAEQERADAQQDAIRTQRDAELATIRAQQDAARLQEYSARAQQEQLRIQQQTLRESKYQAQQACRQAQKICEASCSSGTTGDRARCMYNCQMSC